MQVRIKSLQGDEYLVEVQNDQLVSHLKTAISEKANGLPIDRLKLVYKGRTMHDSSSINEYNLENNCKVHLILRKEEQISTNPSSKQQQSMQVQSTPTLASLQCPMDVSPRSTDDQDNNSNDQGKSSLDKKQSRFETILRERLEQFFSPHIVEQIMKNLQKEINADINSSSLDDLERLAKQKLNISNE